MIGVGHRPEGNFFLGMCQACISHFGEHLHCVSYQHLKTQHPQIKLIILTLRIGRGPHFLSPYKEPQPSQSLNLKPQEVAQRRWH